MGCFGLGRRGSWKGVWLFSEDLLFELGWHAVGKEMLDAMQEAGQVQVGLVCGMVGQVGLVYL